MADKTIDQNPKVTDTIVFELETPDVDGCFLANPYKVDNLKIYYVERNFVSAGYGEYDKEVYQDSVLAKFKKAQADYCASPTEEGKALLSELQTELEDSANVSSFYYNEAKLVEVVGNETTPAWLSSDVNNALIINVDEDEDGNTQYGRFNYPWSPAGKVREGDYFCCWTWTPEPAGDSLSNHVYFRLDGDPRAVTTIPSHMTPPEKYDILLERYLPEMYKSYLSDNDITPETLQKFNQAVAQGFKGVEDLANQLIDLFDANALHESMLVYLSNLFHLRLKSGDPTLWRRQIKEAVPLFKKKGTERGLKEAFAQAGMVLNKVTKLWQVVSSYTWQESFVVDDVDNLSWRLSKNVIESLDSDNFELAIRKVGDDDYAVVSSSSVDFAPSACSLFTDMTWTSEDLDEGDIVRVLYQYADVPSGKQATEDYIRLLPLADNRDERDQRYPLKNWNVRVIEEDDPMFDVIVPVRHPFQDPLVFGKIRTEFPYSENIYNMDEYNGSTRESGDPCHIDKDFIDPCGSCLSSKYNLDVGVEDLSDDRIKEVKDILREYVPFHAFVQSINYQGEVVEFVASPVEEIEALMKWEMTETVLSGNANTYFTRTMPDGTTLWKVERDQMADLVVSLTGKTGTAYNDHVALYAPSVNLEKIGLKPPGSHVFQVLSPSPNSGFYQLTEPDFHLAKVVSGVAEPVNSAMFTFRISNIQIDSNTAAIQRADTKAFKAASSDFVSLGVQGQWDVANVSGYSGGVWKIVVSGTTYDVYTTLPDGSVVLADPSGTLPTSATSGLTYTLLDPSGNSVTDVNGDQIGTGSDGVLVVINRGSVDLNDSLTISEYVQVGDYLVYSGTEYLVDGIDGGEVQFQGYTGGAASGVTVEVRRRLVDKAVGYFDYAGLRLKTSSNHESELGILNGDNPPTTDPDEITDNSLWKENFLFLIGSKYYKIVEIDGDEVVLDGERQAWTTWSAGGTSVNYEVHHFVKDTVEAQFLVFDQLDRSGKDPVVREITSTVTNDVAVVALQAPPGAGVLDNVQQEEGVSFEIEYKSGMQEKGEVV